MKNFAKKLSANLVVSIFAALLFYTFASFLGWGESRTGRYSGIEPYWMVFGTGILGVCVGRQMHGLSKERILWGIPQALFFLTIGAWFYTGATGIVDLTMPPQESPIPFVEGLAWIYGIAALGFLIGVFTKIVGKIGARPQVHLNS